MLIISQCNGAIPACGFCTELGFQCVYEQPQKAAQSKSVYCLGNEFSSYVAHSSCSSRQEKEYDERLKAIEDTLSRLVRQSEDGPGQATQTTHTAEAASLQNSHRTQSQNLGLLDTGGVEFQIMAEDTIDGMAAVADADGADSRFFGEVFSAHLNRLP